MLGLAVEAQTTPPAECPTINVLGPAGIPNPDEFIPYVVELKGDVPPEVAFIWSVSTGKVAEGQGTAKVKIDAPEWLTGVSVTATVKVLGLPEGCPNTGSETMAVSIDPGPILVGSTGNATNYPTSFRELIEALEKHPNSQGYIFIGTSNSDRFQEIVRLIRDTARLSGFDQSRLTIKPEATSSEIVELWVIRPGVDNPSCRSCEPVERLECGLPSDEYGRIPKNEELGRLDTTAANLIMDSSWIGVVILFVAPDESKRKAEARKTLIRDHLVKTRKVPDERLDIYFARGHETRTSIYLMAPELRMTPKSAFDAEPSFDRLPRRN